MRDENKMKRQAQIELAAYEMLEHKGYAGTTMQGIARKAKASNETLYSWYGDKQGLFKALIARNAEEVKAFLAAESVSDHDATGILGLLGPKLLKLLLGDRAIALNRAAAAEPSGELGQAIAQEGREAVVPLLEKCFSRARSAGQLSFVSTDDAVGLYVDLLVGDLQIRRVIGRLQAPTDEFCAQRSEQALVRLHILMEQAGQSR